jgi:hypothetical protein
MSSILNKVGIVMKEWMVEISNSHVASFFTIILRPLQGMLRT